MQSSLSNDPVVDTLKLSDQEYRRILNSLNTCEAHPDMRRMQRRQALRYPFTGQFVLSISHPDGTRGNYLGRTRDISAKGLALLHGCFLHVNTHCFVLLPMRDGRWMRIGAVVVRCRHVQGKTHEVGVRFEEEIDVTAITDPADASHSTTGLAV